MEITVHTYMKSITEYGVCGRMAEYRTYIYEKYGRTLKAGGWQNSVPYIYE
jgi:hypothetical protein